MAQARTLKSEETWKSDDGQLVKYKVVLDMQGQQITTETFSRKVAQVGFSGEVEKYQNKRGDWLVRQPKNDAFRGSRSFKNDPESMYRTSALKNATEYVYSVQGELTVEDIPRIATILYKWLMNPVEHKEEVAQVAELFSNGEQEKTEDVVLEDIDESQPINMDDIPF